MKEYVTFKLKECMLDDDMMFEVMQGQITERARMPARDGLR